MAASGRLDVTTAKRVVIPGRVLWTSGSPLHSMGADFTRNGLVAEGCPEGPTDAAKVPRVHHVSMVA